MQYVGIGGLLVVLAALLIWSLITELTRVAKAIGAKLVRWRVILARWRSKLARWISRADLGMQATIPKAIESFSEKALIDKERIALANYEPIPYQEIKLKIHKYEEQFPSFFTDFPPAAIIVDIGQIPSLLNFDVRLPFQEFLNMENRPSPEFPYPRLNGIGDIKQPPEWKLWVADKTELEFSEPVYTGWRAIFNRYVKAAYAEEVNRVNLAKLNQLKMEECFSIRNEKLSKLKQQAVEKYEAAVSLSQKNWASVCRQDKQRRDAFKGQFQAEQEKINGEIARINSVDTDGFIARVEWMLRTLKLPHFVSREGRCRYDADSRILIFEHRLPDLSTLGFVKAVQLKAGWTLKPANQKEAKEAALKIYPSLAIRFAAELRKLDFYAQADAIVVNGWAEYIEQSTGQMKRAYCSSMFATVDQIDALNLAALNPVSAFSALKGLAARSLEVTPIAPIFRIDTNDKRFVEAKEVIGKLNDGENLAAMDWEDFEHLCRELFERAFAGSGAEVKVTQASRDQGRR